MTTVSRDALRAAENWQRTTHLSKYSPGYLLGLLEAAAPRIREQAAAEILRPVPYEGDKETGEIYEAAQAVQIALGASRRAGVCVEWKPPGSDKAWRVWVEDRDNPHLHAHCHSDWTCEHARNLRGEQ